MNFSSGIDCEILLVGTVLASEHTTDKDMFVMSTVDVNLERVGT